MENKLFNSVVNFTKEFILDEKGQYTAKTDIEMDIGITGDDAADYIVEFGKRFNVDVSDFDFDEHFDPEGTIFFFREMRNKNKKPITIEVLINSILSGKLC